MSILDKAKLEIAFKKFVITQRSRFKFHEQRIQEDIQNLLNPAYPQNLKKVDYEHIKFTATNPTAYETTQIRQYTNLAKNYKQLTNKQLKPFEQTFVKEIASLQSKAQTAVEKFKEFDSPKKENKQYSYHFDEKGQIVREEAKPTQNQTKPEPAPFTPPTNEQPTQPQQTSKQPEQKQEEPLTREQVQQNLDKNYYDHVKRKAIFLELKERLKNLPESELESFKQELENITGIKEYGSERERLLESIDADLQIAKNLIDSNNNVRRKEGYSDAKVQKPITTTINFNMPVNEHIYENDSYGFTPDGTKLHTSAPKIQQVENVEVELDQSGRINFNLPGNKALLSRPDIVAKLIETHPEALKTLPSEVYALDAKQYIESMKTGLQNQMADPELSNEEKAQIIEQGIGNLRNQSAKISQNGKNKIADAAALSANKQNISELEGMAQQLGEE